MKGFIGFMIGFFFNLFNMNDNIYEYLYLGCEMLRFLVIVSRF